MIKSLEELRNSESLDNLYKYYEESLGKSQEEIKILLKEYGVEVSDECAKECFNFCKEVATIKDEELSEVAGGVGEGGSVPSKTRNYINKAIKILDDEKRYNTTIMQIASKKSSEDLKMLLIQPFERESFKQGLTRIVVEDIGILAFSNTSLNVAAGFIQEAQRTL